MATEPQRKHLHALMALLLAHEPQIHYPLHDVRGSLDDSTFALTEAQMKATLASGGRLMMDCSQAITCLCKWARLKDPNGLDWRWPGFTGTLLAHLSHYSNPVEAHVGGIVVFGPGTGEHAAMVMEPGPDPLLWSHGFDGGPIAIRLSVERRFHHSPVTFCSIAKL